MHLLIFTRLGYRPSAFTEMRALAVEGWRATSTSVEPLVFVCRFTCSNHVQILDYPSSQPRIIGVGEHILEEYKQPSTVNIPICMGEPQHRVMGTCQWAVGIQ